MIIDVFRIYCKATFFYSTLPFVLFSSPTHWKEFSMNFDISPSLELGRWLSLDIYCININTKDVNLFCSSSCKCISQHRGFKFSNAPLHLKLYDKYWYPRLHSKIFFLILVLTHSVFLVVRFLLHKTCHVIKTVKLF